MMLNLLTKRRESITIRDFKKEVFDIKDTNHMEEILYLVQITKEDIQALHLIAELIEEHAPTMAERHYQMIQEIPEIKGIFHEFTTYERYTNAIIVYYKQLSKPVINDAYIEYRKKIGRIHSRIKLSEEWYIGSYMRVYEYIIPFITDKFKSDPITLSNILVALNRIIHLDTIIVLESYREAISSS